MGYSVGVWVSVSGTITGAAADILRCSLVNGCRLSVFGKTVRQFISSSVKDPPLLGVGVLITNELGMDRFVRSSESASYGQSRVNIGVASPFSNFLSPSKTKKPSGWGRGHRQAEAIISASTLLFLSMACGDSSGAKIGKFIFPL